MEEVDEKCKVTEEEAAQNGTLDKYAGILREFEEKYL
jgi:hemerythrin-like domain-containing protein